METLYMSIIGIFILYFYGRVSYYFYKKDKKRAASFVANITYGFFAVVLFVFPYLSLLGKLGEQLNFSQVRLIKNFGGYLLGSAYFLGVYAIILAFCLLFIIGITLIIKGLSDFLEHR
ncbi:MAG: hypothetical protein ACI976_001653 [Aureispira sp.]|jgi:hypothetical protein